MRPGGYVIIGDEFVGQGTHDIEVNFQFAPGARLALVASDAVGFGDIAALHWFARERWTADLADSGEGPDGGWIAPSLGVKQRAARLSLRQRSSAPRAALLTLLVPGPAAGPALEVRRDADGTTVVSGPGFTDFITAPLGGDERRDDDAFIEVRRVNGAGATQVTRLQAPHRRLMTDGTRRA